MNGNFSENALTVLRARYLNKDQAGHILESPEQLFKRVAGAVSGVERHHRSKYEKIFYEFMMKRRFLPNSPTLMNAGKESGQLSACYVLPVEDSLEGIFESLKSAARIHQSGGGTGFSFSNLRQKGAAVQSSHGVASGPVSFIRIYDVATETIKQGGTRRGANMGILRVDHPDVYEFVDSKRDRKSILNFNISVAVTQEFMRAVETGACFSLRDPRTKDEVKKISARDLFEKIVNAAWECGDPGLVFIDRIEFFNPTPMEGEIESTNPCGEQPLLPYESCNLGSLNLGEYFLEGNFNWKLFREDIRKAVRFLDNVIDLNAFPLEQSEGITRRNRKTGLGVMGLADLLLYLEIPYSSEAARSLSEKIMAFLDREAKRASIELAKERGPFPNFKQSLWKRLGFPPLRNATVSTVAPTGTISIIADASSGIEPIFSGIFYRNVLGGKKLIDVHPALKKVLLKKGFDAATFRDEQISQILGGAWAPAANVPVEDHIRMQAVFQRHSDSAVSKTINLPEAATREDVAKAYRLAYELGCKGITVYRDKSRPLQVLERAGEDEDLILNLCPTCQE